MNKISIRQCNKLRAMLIIALTKDSKFKLISPNNFYSVPSLRYLLKWLNKGTMSRLTANRIIMKNYNSFTNYMYKPKSNFKIKG